MPEFFNVLPPDEALKLFLAQVTHCPPAEMISTQSALGRVTAAPIASPQALPAFRRSTMDGYALRASDTYGASGSLPAFLKVVREVPMGRAAGVELNTGEAAIVHTGGMIPTSADAVVQVEHTQMVNATAEGDLPYDIEIFKGVAIGQNVLQVGEDVRQGSPVLATGHLIRPQDLGGLLALGIVELSVTKRPQVAILATGDEVIPPDQMTAPGQIRDINSYTVAGLAIHAGGMPVLGGIIPDDFAALKRAAAEMLADHDMLVVSAGSSVSVRDMTVQVIDELGQPGVLLHGVATRPGKPTIIGVVDGKPVLGLPGNPVSAMVQFDMFGTPVIYRMQGVHEMPRRGLVWARLSQNVASESGREDYIPARLEDSADGLLATPVFGKSNLIYTLVKADGLIKVPLNKGGLVAGEWVEVRLF
jgi:molybdopterin molybdotransferase